MAGWGGKGRGHKLLLGKGCRRLPLLGRWPLAAATPQGRQKQATPEVGGVSAPAPRTCFRAVARRPTAARPKARQLRRGAGLARVEAEGSLWAQQRATVEVSSMVRRLQARGWPGCDEGVKRPPRSGSGRISHQAAGFLLANTAIDGQLALQAGAMLAMGHGQEASCPRERWVHFSI